MKPLNLKNWLLAALALPMFTACDMMKEDLDDCPTGLYVSFVYDYNMQRADMFKDHAGTVMLYVYDEADQLVATKTMGGALVSRYGSYIHFSEDELAPGHTYRLLALAMQKDYNDALAQPGYKYRISGNTIGSPRSALTVALDHERYSTHAAARAAVSAAARAAAPAVGYAALPTQPVTRATLTTAPLDTLWHTLTTLTTPADQFPLQLAPAMLTPAKTDYTWQRDGSIQQNGVQTISLVAGEPTYATMSLIRNTKQLHITLQADNADPADNIVKDEDFTVEIIDNNTVVDYQNDLAALNDTVVYRPFFQTTTSFIGTDGVTQHTAAQYDLMFNRLLYKNASVSDDQYAIMTPTEVTKQKNATLLIRNATDGTIVFGINLPYVLSSARTYQERYYHYQEYLDREYDYRLQFIIRGGRVVEIQYFIGAEVHIIPWAVRTQHETLE